MPTRAGRAQVTAYLRWRLDRLCTRHTRLCAEMDAAWRSPEDPKVRFKGPSVSKA
jgi:hypothetical protein